MSAKLNNIDTLKKEIEEFKIKEYKELITDYKNKITYLEACLAVCEDNLKKYSNSTSKCCDTNAVQQKTQTTYPVKETDVLKLYKALSALGEAHLDAILDYLHIDKRDQRKKESIAGTLNRYARNEKLFVRTKPRCYKLLASKRYKPANNTVNNTDDDSVTSYLSYCCRSA